MGLQTRKINTECSHLLLTEYGNHFGLQLKAIENQIEGVSLVITGKNILPEKTLNGKLERNKDDLLTFESQLHKTTDWFSISSHCNQYLVMSGDAYNCALWQFMDADGTILQDQEMKKLRRLSDMKQERTFSVVKIPDQAVRARVYYANETEETVVSLMQSLQIEYGRVPTSFEPYQEQIIKLPGLMKGDSLIYEDNIWRISNGSEEKSINLPAINISNGCTLRLEGTFSCDLTVRYNNDKNQFGNVLNSSQENKSNQAKIYGIRHRIDDPSPVCERIDDAKNLHFNYVVGDKFAAPYQNDFDEIYPWSMVRLCAVKHDDDGNRMITYEDSPEFERSGLVGQIMVEIPKYYAKREKKDGYEYLWICGEEQEGFELDPSFITKKGIVPCIYIGAYLSSMKNKYFQCISDTFPALRKNMNEIRRMTAAIGHGMYSECDLLAVLTVQRLFLVEAANLDSQTVFEGVVHIPYIIKNKESSYYAINSKTESNTIVLRKSKVTKQFMKNDCVALLENWKDYKNTPDICQRTIIKIEDIDDETFEVTFSGVPMDIIEGQTGLTCLPRKNGDTDDLCYHSGKCDMPSGHASFKYRHIENFWGSLSILLENVTVCNNEMTIQYPDGTTKKLGYQLPAQDIILLPKNFGAPTQMCIKEMGYDKTQPLLMLPSVIGDGASTSTYYCDAWYNMAEEDVTYLVSYGGAWDNRGYAGIFDFRAGFNEEERIPFNGSRMMIR